MSKRWEIESPKRRMAEMIQLLHKVDGSEAILTQLAAPDVTLVSVSADQLKSLTKQDLIDFRPRGVEWARYLAMTPIRVELAV